MSIVKGLYEAPQGISALADEPAIEIEIEDPESVDIKGPGFEIHIEEGEQDFDANLAEELTEQEMQSIVSEIVADYEDDVASRRDWIKAYVDGLELLGLKIEERTDPWPGACGVYHPLLSEALVKFQAETIMEIFPASGPARIEIVGLETPEKKEAALRVEQDMNYMLTDTMTEYRSETERMLWGLGLSGNAFKKIYYDPHTERPAAIFCPAEDVVVPYGASNIETSPRVTHVMRKTENELRRLQVMGFYRDIDLGEPNNTMDEVEKKIAEKMGFRATSDFRYKLLEIQVDLDLPGYEHKNKNGEPTGIALPYLVTVEHGSNQVLSIRRNWEEGDKTFQKRQHFVHYGYVPGFGFYYFGLIHLIGAFAKSGTSLIRQLVDAGTLANLPGGFKTRGMRVKGDDTPIAPAEFRDVDVPSGAIKDNLMLLPYKEPSQVLMTLLNQIVEDGRRFANTADLATADLNANAPVGTTLAILERTMKVMTAVQARVHYSLKQELRLLKKIIAAYTPKDYSYEPQEGGRSAKQSDYNNVDVIPVSDPNASTMSQKVVQWSAVMQLAQGSPQLYDMAYLHRQMIETLGIQNAAKIIPMPEDQKPYDPITENMDALNGNPMKAFIYQDHQAHITAHQSFLSDPSVAQTIAQNPRMNQITASMQAHIAEHLGFLYRNQIEQQMGVTMPEPGKELPPETEMQLSRLIAQASVQLNTINTNQAAQTQIQQQLQDPLIQLQQQELQLKAQAQQAKTAKDQAEIQAKMAQIQVERERIQSQMQIEHARLAVQQQKNQTQAEIDMAREKLRLGVQAAIKDSELDRR
jgi:hypothetical protein